MYLLGDLLENDQDTTFSCTSDKHCSDAVKTWTCDIPSNSTINFTIPGNSTISGVCYGKLSEWRTLAWIGGALCCALFAGVLIILPESPAFLVSAGKEAEARRVLVRVRDSPIEVERDMAQARHGLEALPASPA